MQQTMLRINVPTVVALKTDEQDSRRSMISYKATRTADETSILVRELRTRS